MLGLFARVGLGGDTNKLLKLYTFTQFFENKSPWTEVIKGGESSGMPISHIGGTNPELMPQEPAGSAFGQLRGCRSCVDSQGPDGKKADAA